MLILIANLITRHMFETERVIPPTSEQVSEGATYAPAFHGKFGQVNVSFPV